jgi:hypothetical protein
MIIHECHIIPPSGQCPGVLQTKASLLRCADKHRICDSSKNQRQKAKASPKPFGSSPCITYCDTSALTGHCLLRCANKHSVSALKTKDKTLKAMCLLHCAHKHSLSEFKSSKPKSKRQNPVGTKCRGRKSKCSAKHPLWL